MPRHHMGREQAVVSLWRRTYLRIRLAYYTQALAQISPLHPDVLYIMLRIREINDELNS